MAYNDQTNENKQANQLNQSVDSASPHLGQYPVPCPSCGYCPTCGQRRWNGNYQYLPYGFPGWTTQSNTTTPGMAQGGTIHGL